MAGLLAAWRAQKPPSRPVAWQTLTTSSARFPFSFAPAIVPAILALGGGSYGVLYAVAGLCAVIGAFAVLPVKRVR